MAFTRTARASAASEVALLSDGIPRLSRCHDWMVAGERKENSMIQKNWQELIKPNKIEFSSKGRDARPRWSPSRSSAASA